VVAVDLNLPLTEHTPVAWLSRNHCGTDGVPA
jgi:hypothetical protein